MVTVFHYTPVNAKQFDGLNIDGLAEKRQKFPRQNFALYGSCYVHTLVHIVIAVSLCIMTMCL